MKTNLAEKTINQTFNISKTSLLEFLKLAKPSTAGGLSSVIFGVKYQRLVATFSNRSASITVNLGPYGYTDQYPVLVGFKDIWAIASKLKAESLAISWDEKRLYIESGETKQSVYCSADCQQFYLPSIEMIKFPSLAIIDAMPAILKCVAKESPRHYGAVSKVYVNKLAMGFVGTDGFRLCLSEYRLGTTDYSRFNDLCLTRETCEQLLIAAKSNEDISIGISEDRTTLAMAKGDIQACFFTSSVRYPNYAGVLPKISRGPTFEVKELLSAVKQALTTTCKKRVFKITSKNGKMLISSRSDETLENWSEYAASFSGSFEMNGDPLFINGKFLADCLSVTKEKIGMFCMTDNREEPIKIVLGTVETVLVPVR